MKSLHVMLLGAALTAGFAATGCGHTRLEEKKSSRVVVIKDKEEGRSWLGVTINNVTSRLAEKQNLSAKEGAYVNGVSEESPADKAGLREGDVIVEFDGRTIRDSEDLQRAVRATGPGKEVVIGVVRDGNRQSLKAVIEERPERVRSFSFKGPAPPPIPRFSMSLHRGAYGLTLEELNPQLGAYFGAPDGRGVLVKKVESGSEAEKAGFKAGDVIVKIGKNEVADVKDIRMLLRDYKKGESAEFDVLRKGSLQKLTMKVDGDRIYGYGGDFRMEFTPEEERQFKEDMREFKLDMQELKKDLKREMERLEWELRDIPKEIHKMLQI